MAGAEVVGGYYLRKPGEGIYLLRVPADSTGERLCRALARLGGLPQVNWASPSWILPSR